MPAERLPYFPFFARDFLASSKVMAMSAEEVGCYTLLLCTAWGQEPVGTLPADDAVLARWCRVSIETWATIRGRVLAPFTLGEDGRWHQPRMEAEAVTARAKYERRANAGREGGLAKSKQSSSNATAMPEQCSSSGLAGAYESESVSSLASRAEKNEILTAIEKWAGRQLNPARNEVQKFNTAMMSWEQDTPNEGGVSVPWGMAVRRCIRSAQAKGTTFTSVAYAITVISGKMSEFTRGIPPEQQTNGQDARPVGEYKPPFMGAYPS